MLWGSETQLPIAETWNIPPTTIIRANGTENWEHFFLKPCIRAGSSLCAGRAQRTYAPRLQHSRSVSKSLYNQHRLNILCVEATFLRVVSSVLWAMNAQWPSFRLLQPRLSGV